MWLVQDLSSNFQKFPCRNQSLQVCHQNPFMIQSREPCSFLLEQENFKGDCFHPIWSYTCQAFFFVLKNCLFCHSFCLHSLMGLSYQELCFRKFSNLTLENRSPYFYQSSSKLCCPDIIELEQFINLFRGILFCSIKVHVIILYF